jgi:hypothetical protein
MMTTGASALAENYLSEAVCLHGVASSMVTDRDPRFTSKFWQEVQCLCGTQLMMSTVFHPETDSATEHANRVIDNILQAVVKPDQSDWEEKLPMVEFAMNLLHNKSTGFAPFELNYGYTVCQLSKAC